MIRPAKRTAAALIVLVVAGFLLTPASFAQEEEKKPLYELEPFDRITLNERNGGAVLTILPLKLAVRVVPDPKPSGKLRLRKTEDPEREYDLSWTVIEKLELFEMMVLAEADQLVQSSRFDEAYAYFVFLRINYPRTPGLKNSLEEFLFLNGGSIRATRPFLAFAILEELYRRNPQFAYRGATTVTSAINSVAEGILDNYIKNGDFSTARKLLTRLDDEYTPQRLPMITKFKERLNALAVEKKAVVEQHAAAKKYRAAYDASREMLNMWPTVAGGKALADQMAHTYPIVIVGVADRSSVHDPAANDNWPARRTGRLIHRNLLEFRGAGPEGGEYESPWGTIERSEDFRRLTYTLNESARIADGSAIDGFHVARRLLNMADPRTADYRAAWADLFDGVSVNDVYTVEINLRRPNVLADALLQVPLQPIPEAANASFEPEGGYRLSSQDSNEVIFLRQDDYQFRGDAQPAEIVERTYADTQFAVAALRNGEIDVVDRLFPAQAASLKTDDDLEVRGYESPTLHMLVPNFERPYPASRTFRRALLYATNRDLILNQTLLENSKLDGCRVISGPFPAPREAEDPLAYAYDEKIVPRSYFPRQAKVLMSLAEFELNDIARRKNEKPPKLGKIVLAHPANEQATIACRAIASQWRPLELDVELKPLPPGESYDESRNWDFLYVEMMMGEPIVDARKLLGPEGVSRFDDPYIGLGLRRLETSTNWRQVRERLVELHRLSYSQLVVIPLWQVVDHFAYHRGVNGLGDRPASLYQNIENWEIEPRPID
ncbi:MAG: ABC transporter substrate-binding protein [Pirellulaceae bacterium]|jgi:ABC-type transport system substrate-binding protein|nr:ABC transporter substrate-binding protein [Pirellulaceae bacterium]MDP7018742.1 ABC transporter substrate-binding protein [Pirellulaceae bacterium]